MIDSRCGPELVRVARLVAGCFLLHGFGRSERCSHATVCRLSSIGHYESVRPAVSYHLHNHQHGKTV